MTHRQGTCSVVQMNLKVASVLALVAAVFALPACGGSSSKSEAGPVTLTVQQAAERIGCATTPATTVTGATETAVCHLPSDIVSVSIPVELDTFANQTQRDYYLTLISDVPHRIVAGNLVATAYTAETADKVRAAIGGVSR